MLGYEPAENFQPSKEGRISSSGSRTQLSTMYEHFNVQPHKIQT